MICVWNIWTSRNSVIFRNQGLNVEEVVYLVHIKTWICLNRKNKKTSFTFSD